MKDEWLRAAISDDTVVADLLLRLKQSPSSSSSSSLLHSQRQPPPQTQTQTQTQAQAAVFILKPLPPSWGLRQPRSKPSSTSSSSFFDKKRRSPTTPLSWTGGGASPSEGCDESLSSHHHPPPPSSDRSRSKVSASTEAATTTTSKRPRRKKTFAELKEEENSLIKERTHLKKELATLRGTLKEQRSINEKLKRMKVDQQADSRIKSEANSVDERSNNVNNGISEAASSSVTTRQDKVEDASKPVSSPSQKCATSQDALFMLPDLNMVPEEDSIVGMSS